MRAFDRYNHPRRLVDIGLLGLSCLPAFRTRRRDEAIARLGHRRIVLQAQRDAQDIRRVGFEHNRLALAIEFEARILRMSKRSG